MLDAHEFRTGFLRVLLENREKLGLLVRRRTPSTAAAAGGAGRMLEKVRRLLQPIQKLFWNPNPMISALSRQADLNNTYVHLIHNLAEELTRVNLDVQDLRNRVLQLQGRLELQARREKALEALVAEATSAGPGPSGRG